MVRSPSAAVLTTDKGDILYISGRTGKYLEPAVGRANLNVFAMAREGLRQALPRAFAAAVRDGHPVTRRGIRVGTDGATQTIDLTIQQRLQTSAESTDIDRLDVIERYVFLEPVRNVEVTSGTHSNGNRNVAQVLRPLDVRIRTNKDSPW